MLCVGIRCRQLAIRLAPSRRLEFTTPFRNFSFATRAMATDAAPETMFALDPFCLRQFDNPSNVAFIDMKPEEFMSKLDAACKAQAAQAPDGNILHPGYAPFCKHVFVENFTELQVNTLPINGETKALIESGYEARTEKELPVLVRYVTKQAYEAAVGRPLPKAKFLDIILYSRKQLIAEAANMSQPAPTYSNEWAVISVKPQDVDHELPMNPITVMRNGLGMDQGGSGKPIMREEYMRSVAYWQDNVAVRHKPVTRIAIQQSAGAASSKDADQQAE
eukprot:INCI13430.10.p1 GENE.INCI13430.10~~INCI13430.10.p1  ORF type:complete len:277 (+),score=39.52 INCI13430.10:299-1129(+)